MLACRLGFHTVRTAAFSPNKLVISFCNHNKRTLVSADPVKSRLAKERKRG